MDKMIKIDKMIKFVAHALAKLTIYQFRCAREKMAKIAKFGDFCGRGSADFFSRGLKT